MMNGLPGVYRGFVRVVSDTQERLRYRVRIPHVHPSAFPDQHLPWAEHATFGGKDFGDFPHFEEDDTVWVMFEGGDAEKPVIVGGWLTQSSGIPDLPPEMDGDYENDRRRWVRIDRRGNRLELSERVNEQWVRLVSGNAEVRITRNDDSVTVEAEGPVNIIAHNANIKATKATIEAVTAKVETTEKTELYSQGETNLYAADTVRIGQYLTSETPPTAKQTTDVGVQPENLQLGLQAPADESEPTLKVTIEGKTKVEVKSEGEVAVQSDGTASVEAETVSVKGTTLVTVESDTEVDIKAPVVNVTS